MVSRPTALKSEALLAEFHNEKLTVSDVDKLMQRFQKDVDSDDYADKWPKSAYSVSKMGALDAYEVSRG